MNGHGPMPRTQYKLKAERLEVQLNGALRRAEWAEKDAKAAKYDVIQLKEENQRLRAELKRANGQAALPTGEA